MNFGQEMGSREWVDSGHYIQSQRLITLIRGSFGFSGGNSDAKQQQRIRLEFSTVQHNTALKDEHLLRYFLYY